MKTRITAVDFGRCSPLGTKVYVIMYKKHWWNRWSIRDWEDKTNHTPRFYYSLEEARRHL